MHRLPCANGGEDAVCMALAQLSKELLEPHAASRQMASGGCDSSDCLFCQYRSNSPFHLNAYAGKLTSLLGKRSVNGMGRPSFTSLTDPSPEHRAAPLATAVSAKGLAKRQKSLSTVGSLEVAADCSGPALAAPSLPPTAEAGHAHPRPLAEAVGPHDCSIMCGSRACHGQYGHVAASESPEYAAAQPSAEVAAGLAPSGVVGTAAAMLGGLVRMPTESSTAVSAAAAAMAATVVAVAAGAEEACAGSADEADAAATTVQGAVREFSLQAEGAMSPVNDAAGPGPSSVRAMQRDPTPTSHAGPLAGTAGHASGEPCHPGRPQFSAVALPEGWSFQPEWRERLDPAPAALREVLRLPPRNRSSSSAGGGAAAAYCRPGGERAGIVCALEFSPDGMLLAAGGVDKQIRLYNLSGALGVVHADDDEGSESDDELLHWGTARGADAGTRRMRCADEEDELLEEERLGVSAPAVVHRMPSKISSMAWSPFLDGVLTVGDYDGVLLQLHIASGHQLADVEAHGGRKIWSVAHSSRQPHLVASAADDRCARLWSGRSLEQCVATLQPNVRASVCSVDFSPDVDHLLALACSDRTAYLYDTRQLGRGPLAALQHHSRPASYCRFLGPDRLVTAATDASLALWDLRDAAPSLVAVMSQPAVVPAAATSEPPRGASNQSPFLAIQQRSAPTAPASCSNSVSSMGYAADGAAVGPSAAAGAPCRVFRGHRNEKNFVGLSVRGRDGLLACGSECSRAFAYHTSWSAPLATLDLTDPRVAPDSPGDGGRAAAARASGTPLGAPSHGVVRRTSTCGDAAGFVSAVCWQPADAAALLGLPPLLASATSTGAINLSVLAAR